MPDQTDPRTPTDPTDRSTDPTDTADPSDLGGADPSDDFDVVGLDPEVNPAGDPDLDLRTRWLPSPAQIQEAVTALNNLPSDPQPATGPGPEVVDAEWVAVVALAQPGKTYGIWRTGQRVVPVPGVWVGQNTTAPVDRPLGAARDAAEQAAQEWLAAQGLPGTPGYAFVHADGSAAVFEGFPAR